MDGSDNDHDLTAERSHSQRITGNKHRGCLPLRSEDSDVETITLDDSDSENDNDTRIEVDENSIRSSIPKPIKPHDLLLPNRNLHKQWTFCRVFSQEIHSALDQHMKEGDELLSRHFLGQIFHEKVTQDTDFDPSIFFQAVQVTKMGRIFMWGNGSKRLVSECQDIPTADNNHLSDAVTKGRKIITEGSLAELLASCLEEGDFLIIFSRDAILEHANKFLTLNSRYEGSVSVVQYRHDGVFGPPAEGSNDFAEFLWPYRNRRLTHSFEEFGKSEVLIRVEPNLPPDRSTSARISKD